MNEPTESGLPDHVSQQIDTLATLHARGESEVSIHQRTIEKVTAFLGRPLFLNLTIALVAVWVFLNLPAQRPHFIPFDPPPFSLLSWLVSTGGLLVTIVVLITQNRQARLAERRAQLDLQVNLLAEQKIAKVIALLEELRRDSPNIKNRADPEAEAMSESADAHAVLDALEEKLEAKRDDAEEKADFAEE
jgi:uncharacterized membrane protein